MDTGLIIVILMFLFGILQGFTVCSLTCAPLLVLRLAGLGRGALDGLKLSFFFTFPRIVILTMMGGALGALGHSSSRLAEISSFPFLQAIVYLIIAIIMIATGMKFVGMTGRKDNTCNNTTSLRGKVITFLLKLGPGKGSYEGRSLMGVGILISVICFVEASGASLAVASLLGVDSSDIGNGILTGALTMLSYSLGLSTPLLLLGTGASEIGRKANTEDIRIIGGILLILIGIIIIIAELIMILT